MKSYSSPVFFFAGITLIILMLVGMLSPIAAPASADQATPPPAVAYLPPAVSDVVVPNRVIDPPFLMPGQEVQVVVRLSGAGRAECLGAPARPLDLILVYDVSSSAGSGPGSNWEQTVKFTQALIDQLTQPVYRSRTGRAEQSRLGLITSQTAITGPVPMLLQDLTEAYDSARAAIAGVTPGGDTDIAAGVQMAADLLLQQPPDRAKAIVLMLHDNVAVDANAIASAANARGQGIRVYLVVNSLNIAPEKQITPDLAAALVEPGNFFPNPQPRDLRLLFVNAAEGDPNRAASDIRVVEAYAPPGSVELSAVSGPGGRIEGERVVWDIPALAAGETVELTYRVRLRPGAQGPIAVTGGMAYIDCNGYLYTSLTDEQMSVAPAPTPTPVEIPVGTPTPTPAYIPPPGPTAPPAPPVTPMPPPSVPRLILTGAPCTQWYLYLLPLLIPLLILLLLWLLSRFLLGIRNWRYEWEQRRWRCRLSFLAFLLYLLLVGFLAGRALAGHLCWQQVVGGAGASAAGFSNLPTPIPTPVRASGLATPLPPITSTTGLRSSQNVALVDPYYFMPRPRAYNIADILVTDITSATLAQFDTLVLSQVCDIGTALSSSQKQAVVDWVRQGGKLIIYDSDVCGGYSFYATGIPVVDYSWLPYPFVTDNPGGRGSSSGHFTVVVNDTMVSSDPASPYYIDAAAIDRTEIGDANVMITHDPNWCGDALARNVNNQQGFVHAYAFYGNGLIIYNGLDTDDISEPAMAKIWEQELAQVWDPTGKQRPPSLNCQVRVSSGVASVTLPPFLPVPVTSIPLWPWLLPLIPLLLLIWLLCRRARPPVFAPWEKKPRGEPGFIPPWTPAVTWDPGAALIIGLGGSGRWVLTHLKKNLLDAGSGHWPNQVRLLLLDTSEDERVGGKQVPVTFAGVELSPEEKLSLAQDLGELTRRMYEDPTAEPEMQGWYPARDYHEHLSPADLDLARGTHQRRPLGRAGLFRRIHDEGSRSPIYQRLVQGLRAVKEQIEEGVERAHVIIVGSLAGGMGSAVLCDIAYLVRRAAQDAGIGGSVKIEAFLIAEGAFRAVTTAETPRINTFAALRELARFQLSRGRPYPMIYRLDAPDGSLQNDYIQWAPFDSLYVVDWAGFLSGERPEYGVFPATADVLTLLLDRASQARSNALQPFRDGARNTETRAQALRGEATMGTFGHMALRLPFVTIAEHLKVRFAEMLLREYAVGPDYKGEDLTLKTEQNREKAWSDNIHTEVLRVLGVHWYPAPPGPSPLLIGIALGLLCGLFIGALVSLATLSGWWLWAGAAAGVGIGAAVGAWVKSRRRHPAVQELYLALPEGALPEPAILAAITYAETTERARDMVRPYLAEVSGTEEYIHSRREAFRRYLLEVMAYILNGRAESGVIEARTGKLGYALAFLGDLRDTLNAGAGQVQFLSAGFIGPEKDKIQHFHRMSAALVAVVDEIRADLEAQARALIGRRESESGVYYHLLKRRWELDEHRKEMDRVLVRRYLWTRRAEREGQMVDEDLVTGYYRDYLASFVEPSLEQFHWRIVEQDGHPHLRLYLRLEQDVPLEERAPETLAWALQELGGRYLQTLWEQKNRLLADVMTDHLSHTKLPDTARLLCERSVPLAGHNPHQAFVPPPGAVDISAQLYQAKTFLYVNRNVARQSELAETLQRQMEGVPVEILPATDPFTCSLLQFREVIPLSALDFYHQSEAAYRTNYGIAERGRRAPELGWREPPHVFAAERHALRIEQRLHEIQEVPWPFHPLFVPALEDLDRARLFVLALLNGYIRREGGERYRYRLQLPAENVDVVLGGPEDITRPEAQLVVAMRTFVLGQPAGERRKPGVTEAPAPGLLREAVPGPHEVVRLAEQVQRQRMRDQEQLLSRLERLEAVHFIPRLEERREALYQALPPYLREEATQPGGRELIAFLRLVARDEYRALRSRGGAS